MRAHAGPRRQRLQRARQGGEVRGRRVRSRGVEAAGLEARRVLGQPERRIAARAQTAHAGLARAGGHLTRAGSGRRAEVARRHQPQHRVHSEPLLRELAEAERQHDRGRLAGALLGPIDRQAHALERARRELQRRPVHRAQHDPLRGHAEVDRGPRQPRRLGGGRRRARARHHLDRPRQRRGRRGPRALAGPEHASEELAQCWSGGLGGIAGAQLQAGRRLAQPLAGSEQRLERQRQRRPRGIAGHVDADRHAAGELAQKRQARLVPARLAHDRHAGHARERSAAGQRLGRRLHWIQRRRLAGAPLGLAKDPAQLVQGPALGPRQLGGRGPGHAGGRQIRRQPAQRFDEPARLAQAAQRASPRGDHRRDRRAERHARTQGIPPETRAAHTQRGGFPGQVLAIPGRKHLGGLAQIAPRPDSPVFSSICQTGGSCSGDLDHGATLARGSDTEASEFSPGPCVGRCMTLAAWTICPTCCEAHLAKSPCPRCVAAAPRARLPAPPPPRQPPAPRQAPAPPLPRPPVRREAQPTSGRVSIGGIVTLALILCGVVLLGLKVSKLGVAFCIVPVGVQSFLRIRERRAERAALSDLGLHLHG